MASPYPMRSRTQQTALNQDGQLFKTFEISPRTTSRFTSAYETNKSEKMGTAKTRQCPSPKTNNIKMQKFKSALSQPELNYVDVHSNSINDESVIPGKFRRSDIDFEKTQQNILSHSNEHSFISAQGQLQKQQQKNELKNTLDDQQFENKKSYRKQNIPSCYGVPYRKCHSAMEQKVVSIINKLKSGKDCHKEIETLIERTRKVSIKQLNNKYFISGVQLLSNLALQKDYKQIFTSDLASKLSDGLDELKHRILAQLDNIKGFEVKIICNDQLSYQKLQLVRRAYRVLRKKLRSLKRQEVQNKALQAVNWFINNKVNDLHLFYSELAQAQC